MVVDSAPHLLSMLHTLAGPGTLEKIDARWGAHGARKRVVLTFDYHHSNGNTEVELRLEHCPDPPRPAGYSIDGYSVTRRIVLPQYQLFLEYNGVRTPLADPLSAAVARFVDAVRAGAKPHRYALVAGMSQLWELVAAAEPGS